MSRAVRIMLASIGALFLIGLIVFAILAIWSVDPDLSRRLGQTAGICAIFTFIFGFAASVPV